MINTTMSSEAVCGRKTVHEKCKWIFCRRTYETYAAARDRTQYIVPRSDASCPRSFSSHDGWRESCESCLTTCCQPVSWRMSGSETTTCVTDDVCLFGSPLLLCKKVFKKVSVVLPLFCDFMHLFPPKINVTSLRCRRRCA